MTNVSQIKSLIASLNGSSKQDKNNSGDIFKSLIAQVKSAETQSIPQTNAKTAKLVKDATNNVFLSANLNASASVNTSGNSSFERAATVYDAKGNMHDIKMAFTKTAQNTWAVEVTAMDAAELGKANPNGKIASGVVTFNADGSLATVSDGLLSQKVKWKQGGKAEDISFNFGKTDSTSGLTQYNSQYIVSDVSQDGRGKSLYGKLTMLEQEPVPISAAYAAKAYSA